MKPEIIHNSSKTRALYLLKSPVNNESPSRLWINMSRTTQKKERKKKNSQWQSHLPISNANQLINLHAE
jgi:hypothetical protein